MSTASKIEWTDTTWNPVAGCTWASPGCDHCYAARMTRRLEAMGQKDYTGLTTHKHFNGEVRLLHHRLTEPLGWKKPRNVFVNSMSDLFHPDVPLEFIDRVFAVMNATGSRLPATVESERWHVYQVLTKRPDRMRYYMVSRCTVGFDQGEHPWFDAGRGREGVLRGFGPHVMNAGAVIAFPPTNVWLGTSVENRAVLHRIDELRECPAAVRFLSIEPLLEDLGEIDLAGIDWVIVGGESGPGWRPIEVEWVRNIRHQCVSAGVAFFFKQWAGLRPKQDPRGRKLDGREWNQFPEPAIAAEV